MATEGTGTGETAAGETTMGGTAAIVLASGSASRTRMLADAGVPHVRDPADVDEDAIKSALGGAPVGAVAMRLAEAKALAVSARRPGDLVIGADQMLALGDRRFDKPKDMAAARGHLAAMRGRTHRLVTAVAVARDGAVLWRHAEAPALTMRAFGDAFADAYLAAAGERVLSSVGAYQLEGLGVQLFERIEGDFFTILGMPLLPLLGFLRETGALPS